MKTNSIISSIEKLTHFVHGKLLWCLLSLYGVAILFPQPGLWIRKVTFGNLTWIDHSHISLTIPVIMLSFLLFNAGLGIKLQDLLRLKRSPALLVSGIVGNNIVPVLFIALVWLSSGIWHDPQEVQVILVGLAMVAAMPIAGSSTAWSQNVDGNLALSLGLVFFSTALSPWTTAWILHFVATLTLGDLSEDLHELARYGAGAFLIISVVLPSVLGIAVRFLFYETHIKPFKPLLKLLNLACLLMLSYSNAAVSLPQAFRQPDWDFLIIILLISGAYCSIAFGSGWLISNSLKASRSEQASLMFGLGMNNNGSGLVLSSIALADHSGVMLPIIFYNLFQQVFAGVIDRYFGETKALPAT